MSEKISVLQVGGSMERAVKGDYHIDVKAVLEEAWQQTRKSRISINVGLMFTFILGIGVTMLLSSYLGGIELVMEDPQSFMIINIAVTIVIWPFLAGVEMMGVLHSIGLKTEPKLVFSFLKRGSWVAVCALLTSMLTSIGIQLFVVPGIFLAVSLSLTIPLVVEKKLTPMKAIVISLQATRFQWFKLFAIYSILAMALVVASLPIALLANSPTGMIGVIMFIFAFTYLAPMFYNVKGILYREIFGMQLHTAEGEQIKPNDTFSA